MNDHTEGSCVLPGPALYHCKRKQLFASQHSTSCGKWQAAHALMETLLASHTDA